MSSLDEFRTHKIAHLMVACFWFAKGQGFLDAQNHDAVWFVIFIVLATVHAGRSHSIDARLADRFRFLA